MKQQTTSDFKSLVTLKGFVRTTDLSNYKFFIDCDRIIIFAVVINILNLYTL